MKEDAPKKIPRAPIVVVMGHIDHGKSTLIDYIRKTNTTDKEEGGITQHVSAYEAEVKTPDGRTHKITFLDTPGHEAFCAIRERGSKTADLAVLVVSAEDGVKPQTIEAIKCVKESGVPYLVAINKIDKPNANVDKTKQELAEKEVLLEGWGGTVPCTKISAKTGEGVPELLETLILQAEIEEISGDPDLPATGFVIEGTQDPKKGIIATLVVKDGTVKRGTYIRSGTAYAPARIIEDFRGKPIDEAGPGSPLRIIGWNEAPKAGMPFYSYNTKEEAMEASILEETSIIKAEIVKSTAEKLLPAIIKADALGSLEAIIHEIKKLDSDKIAIKIIASGVGSISESEVKMANSNKDILLLGFNVKIDSSARDIAERSGVEIKTFSIIYELTKWLGDKMLEQSPKEEVEEMTGEAKVLKVFSKNKNKQVIGGRVETGSIEVDTHVKVFRRDAEIGEGRIKELQSRKLKTSRVEEDTEFGALLDSKIEIVAGDKISCYQKILK
jgi:translation initiation factor IF-2